MSFISVALSINLGGSRGGDAEARCKTGGSYICSGPTRGCAVAAGGNDVLGWTCIGTSMKDAMQPSSSKTPVTQELKALLTDHSKK